MASCALSVRVHALRLVDDDDGPRRLHELDRLAAGELVALLVDDVALLLVLGAGEVLAEGVDVDDENLQRVAGGELPQPVDPLRVVDEVLERQVVVERAEMLGGDLDVLQHAFADGNARHNDDELLEAVAPRQLEDRSQINVGLACAGLHLDREVRAHAREHSRPDRRVPSPPAGHLVGDFDVVAGLDERGYLCCSLSSASSRRLPTPSSVCSWPANSPPSSANLDDGILGRTLRLAVERSVTAATASSWNSGWRRIGVSCGDLNRPETATPLVLKICTALVLSWSLPAKPSSRQTTRSGFFPPWPGSASSVSLRSRQMKRAPAGHAVDDLSSRA